MKDEFDLHASPRQWTILDRKQALMQRDPLVRDYDQTLKRWLRDRKSAKLAAQVDSLERKIGKKWMVKIYIPETTIQGLTDFWFPAALEVYKSIEDAREKSSIIFCGETGKITRASFKENNLIYCEPHKIPIIIDPTFLTLNDAKIVKKKVWDIVKAEIEKQRGIAQGRTLVIPPKEPKALAEVLHCRADTFDKYLRWYDWRIHGLPFRLIAHIETQSGYLGEKMNVVQELLTFKRNPKIRHVVKYESAVKKGFALIFYAIHRTRKLDETGKMQLLGSYECPHHEGNTCPSNCDYLEQWMHTHDKLFKELG